ncbi:putative ribonuclease H-like domain-containing protein [Tanacetum coccineum]
MVKTGLFKTIDSLIPLDEHLATFRGSLETETSISKTSKDIVEKPKTVRPSAPIIEEWDTDSDNDSVFRPKSDQTKPKFTKINFVKSSENVKSVNKENTHRQVEYPKKSQSPRGNRRNWNGMMTQKLGNGFEFIKKACFVCGSFNHLIKDCDFHDNKMVEKPVLNNKGRVTGQREIRPLQHSQDKCQLMMLNKALQEQHHRLVLPGLVNNVTTAGPKAVVSAAKENGENVVKSSACWIWRPTENVIDHISKDSGLYMLKRFDYGNPQYTLQDQGIFDSGCSRHMTGNKSFLTDYQEIDGGFVAFGGSPKGGKITGKGKIRTGKLDFEDVYFVKELKFNLFSVSQMCDKKNNVLFTETECLVLSPDFKLLNESQVLLKVPRHDNMYIFDLKNVVPSGGLTCLFTKVTLDESNLWHRRLGHINFKTMNKLVRGNLAFRVFNTRTREVEENLHITFLENKPNFDGSGPDWLFDIDLLTNSMNYELVTAGNQTNKNAGIKYNVDAVHTQQYILLPLLSDSPQSSEDAVADDAGKKATEEPANEGERNGNANITNKVSTVSPYVSVVRQSFDNADDLPTDPLMPDLEDTTDLLNTGIFSGAYDDDDDEGAKADHNNLETTMNVSPIPTTRIHKDHPKDQIIRDINLATQTMRMTKISEEHAMKAIQALADPSWVEAMQEELLQFRLQKVWTLVDLPNGKRAIGTKWVLRNKKDESGIVVRNKTRLVAQYPQFPDKVYKVEKALYGLHQAPRAWYETLSTYLLENRFRRGTIDKTLFIKKDKGDILLVHVYVDDIIFGSTKKSLCVEFEQMSSMGELTFFLGLQVKQKDDGIFISQDKYVADILKKFDFATVKTASTPIETNKALLKDEEAEDVDVHLYRSMIGSLMYLTAFRPDIMFVVYACARDSPFDLEAFSDSDYAGASLDKKSTTGGCQFLGKRLISWQCKKQSIVANSTTEAEYVAAANCCGRVLWIQNQMLDYGFNFMNTKFVDQHNMVACLERTEGNANFHQIVDFLNASTSSSKSTAWNEFSTNIASAVICLANNQKFNFSKLIFNEPFNDTYETPKHTQKVFANMRRKGKSFSGTVTPLFQSMLAIQAVEGEGSGQPSEPQPTPSPAPPSHEVQVTTVASHPQKTHTPRRAKRGRDTKIPQSSGPPKKVGDEAVYTGEDDRVVRAATTATSLEAEQESGNIHKTRSMATLNEPSPQGTGSGSGPRCQDTTLGDADAQTRFETASKQSCDPPLLEVNTSGSGEDSMEHQDDLTDFVPPTPHDSPLSGGHTPGSDEGRPNINELMAICTNLSNRVLALETSKTAQDLVINKLKKKVKRLEKKQRARTPGMKLFKIGTSRRKSLDKENVSKQGRNLKTRSMFEEGDFDDDFDDIDDMVNEAIENVEGDIVNAGGAVNTATTRVSAASASVTTAGVSISTAEPRTPPTTTTTAFEDEDLTIAQTFVKMRCEKAKVKGVDFRDVEESARSKTILLTIDPKDKGKGIMQEPEKPPKNPIKA